MEGYAIESYQDVSHSASILLDPGITRRSWDHTTIPGSHGNTWDHTTKAGRNQRPRPVSWAPGLRMDRLDQDWSIQDESEQGCRPCCVDERLASGVGHPPAERSKLPEQVARAGADDGVVGGIIALASHGDHAGQSRWDSERRQRHYRHCRARPMRLPGTETASGALSQMAWSRLPHRHHGLPSRPTFSPTDRRLADLAEERCPAPAQADNRDSGVFDARCL